jgi:hypothetical protein
MCITAAHLLRKHYNYEVSFFDHLNNKRTYTVKSFVLSDNYCADLNSRVQSLQMFDQDIAVLILDQAVEGLNPLYIPSVEEYNFVNNRKYKKFRNGPKLLTVGYGPDYIWDGYVIGAFPQERKAFWLVAWAHYQNLFFSLPYGISADLKTQRSCVPFEGQTCSGYSGSAVFDPRFGLVGLIVGDMPPKGKELACLGVAVCKDLVPDFNNEHLSARAVWAFCAFVYYLVPVYSIFYNILKYFDREEYMPNHTWFTKPCGVRTVALMLPRHKDWIDEIRREEIGSEV